MNKRIIWNFELNGERNPDCELKNIVDNKSEEKWEARFFWQEHEIITLNGLNINYLNFANCKVKTGEDIYFLLPNSNYNIKMRDDEIVYKPLLEKHEFASAYGKKIVIDDDSNAILLPKNDGELTYDRIKNEGRALVVNKERCIYKLPTEPKSKLELTKLTINQKTFFSLNIQANSFIVVTKISKMLLNTRNSCDYISFLNEQFS